MSDNIKVVVKVRPLISREIEDKCSYQWRVKNNTLYQLDQNGRDLGQCFTFDKVYDEETKTSDVYSDIAKPIVEAAIAGFNGTIFAYGQTSSGKTYTMSGTEQSPGIIQLAVLNLFENIKKIPDRDFLVRVSYVEIYNETLKDLLNVDKKIRIQETLQGVKVDATERVTSTPEEVLEAMKEGEANRQIGATNMNVESSRSHSIFQITIESRDHIEGEEEEEGCVNVSQLNLVDLAGSERSGQTGAKGIRFKEGTHINKSLSVLALVIKQLSEDPKKHINYRDSKLTRILQNSLGGNAKTSIICAVTPTAVEETISTLQFANRAKAIKNKPEVNAVATNATMIQSLTKQLSQLQAELHSKKNLEKDNYNLTQQIMALQRLILNGFGQRSNENVSGNRRKTWCAPRRVTISTLYPIEEDPAPTVHKFCTPVLKYNPMSVTPATDFVPIQTVSQGRLASLSEEPLAAGRVTPISTDKKVNFSDEIIELDSDDDHNSSEVETCSPYHKCYGSSKTPPCVLRKNAEQAEKTLQDIVELTEREKLYKPNVVELMEKLEQYTTVIAKLEDERNTLNTVCKEKDVEMDRLRHKITMAEEEINTISSVKLDLEARCKNYDTKLTDCEVSYETLKRKAKIREDELLSLLDEQTFGKVAKESGKTLPEIVDKELTHFMDMSKDVSLINSDNDSSIVHFNGDESTPQIQDLVKNVQSQLLIKNQKIIALEADLFAQKQKLEFLERTSQQLQGTHASFMEKLSNVENENELLKSTIETLNSTIHKQKENLQIANNDMQSYNDLISELQTKLTEKANVNIDNSLLENMILNEEKFIANNENIKNIIQSFKIAIDTRNKEIEKLKYTLQDNVEKEKQIMTLTEEMKNLKGQLNENVAIINELIQEKGKLIDVEHQLTQNLSNIQEQNDSLLKQHTENANQIKYLRENNDKLIQVIAEKDMNTQEISTRNEHLIRQIEEISQKKDEFERDIQSKNVVIHNQEREAQEYLSTSKIFIEKLRDIFQILSGKTQEIPETVADMPMVFSILCNNLSALESIANEIVSQKQVSDENSDKLNNEILSLKESLQLQMQELRTSFNEERIQLSNELEHLQRKLNMKVEEYTTMLNGAKEIEENLRKELLYKDNLISSLRESESIYNSDIQEKQMLCTDLKHENDNLHATIKKNKELLEQITLEKHKEIEDLKLNLQEIKFTLEEKSIEVIKHKQLVDKNVENVDQLMKNILNKISTLASDFEIENNITCKFENSDTNTYEQIILILDKIANHIILLKSAKINDESDNRILKERNLKLTDDISQIVNKNQELITELEQIQIYNKNLYDNLKECNDLMKNLREELTDKSEQIINLENKIIELIDQFQSRDYLMKQQLEELQTENCELQTRLLEIDSGNIREKKYCEPAKFSDTDCLNRPATRKSLSNIAEIIERTPQSLLTICCNKIIESIQPDETDNKFIAPSSSNLSIDIKSTEVQVNSCQCNELTSKLTLIQEENTELKGNLERLTSVNQELIKEQEDVSKELQLLLQPAHDLQRKIANHKTNLSTLTATTYAENKLLKSQLKVLHHHHNRFHHLCQRDLPEVKKQLCELMAILKRDMSIRDKENDSFKRYSLPDVLDKNCTVFTFNKNESTLDGDLLMLDTNITLTTANSTLLSQDQTCADVTQVYLNNEPVCQLNDLSQDIDPNVICSQMEILTNDNQKMFQKVEFLRNENDKLRELLDRHLDRLEPSPYKIDAQSSPIKMDSLNESRITNKEPCENCKHINELRVAHEKLFDELRLLSVELSETKAQKADLEQKYDNLALEIPSTDTLVRKISTLEKEHKTKVDEITKLTHTLNNKNQELKLIQEENDTLSTQIIETISEADDLRKELDILKMTNINLTEKCAGFEKTNQINRHNKFFCSKCKIVEPMHSKQILDSHSILNRSHSDSDSSSRYNKICTLQNQLDASKEECKQISEDVITIKNHLERDLSMVENMDLDDSRETNIFTFKKDFSATNSQVNKFDVPKSPEEHIANIYKRDKIDCFNYYLEMTGTKRENLGHDFKIIDVLKMLYNNLFTKHNNEVENLINKLKDFEESKNSLKMQIEDVTSQSIIANEQLQQRDGVLAQIRTNISIINEELSNVVKTDNNSRLATMFKEHLLSVLDTGFGIRSVNIFESLIDNIVNKHQSDLKGIVDRYTKLQEHMESVMQELQTVNDNLQQMKSQLSDKENEYNLLKAQKERVDEISKAVTLDIIKKDKELNERIANGYQKLMEHNVITPDDVDSSLPGNINIDSLFERLISQSKKLNITQIVKDNENQIMEVKNLKTIINDKEQELETLLLQIGEMRKINDNIRLELCELKNNFNNQKSLNEDLSKIYEKKIAENDANVKIIEYLTTEVEVLKKTVDKKESIILSIESDLTQAQNSATEQQAQMTKLIQEVEVLRNENNQLKATNEMITKEKETYSLELVKSIATIKENRIELDKMNSDILILRESVRDNMSVIENLKLEASTLLEQNVQLKEQFEEKSRDYSRLELNIKTHEKTAEIQSKMINRLQKQNDEDKQSHVEKDKLVVELTQKCKTMQQELESMRCNVKTSEQNVNEFKYAKESLEARVSELEKEMDAHKPRLSIEHIADNSRRRRQSLHDSRRMFVDDKMDDDNKMDAVFTSRSKPDDLFMDVDDYSSNRSTPIRLSKGRDSLTRDQSDKDEEHSSRSSSVLATRRRRQSTHDIRRGTVAHTPSPHEHSLTKHSDQNNMKLVEMGDNIIADSDMSRLKQRLAACQQELEELKVKYRELDEECETCAEYLHERDEQCARLTKEKILLQQQVNELKEKLCLYQKENAKPTLSHAGVNTDEDWTNLHAVVVDRMSFDAEVEKNKKLTRAIEEFHLKNRDLKAAVAKMQRALEKNAAKDDSGLVRQLASTKAELQCCKQELEELKTRYKELDEECETCAEYLREREEQCRRLKEAKAALEVKLQEVERDSAGTSAVSRRKRRSAHDRNRCSALGGTDVAAETTHDFLSYQVERDESSRHDSLNDSKMLEVQRLKMTVDKLSQQKSALEQQLVSLSSSATPQLPTVYVATGSAIVQNQQLTDIMKENQKLKKMNTKLINICKKRGKSSSEADRENDDPADMR